jgi:hypothetical protein
VVGEVAGHGSAVAGLGAGEAPLPVERELGVAGEPGLVRGQDALQCQVWRCGLEPRWPGRVVRQDVGHPGAGERLDHGGASGHGAGVGFGAAAGGEERVIGVDDFCRYEAFEEFPDAAGGEGGYHGRPARARTARWGAG